MHLPVLLMELKVLISKSPDTTVVPFVALILSVPLREPVNGLSFFPIGIHFEIEARLISLPKT